MNPVMRMAVTPVLQKSQVLRVGDGFRITSLRPVSFLQVFRRRRILTARLVSEIRGCRIATIGRKERERMVSNEPVIEELTVGHDVDVIPAPRVEVAVEIHAASLEAMARGSFRLTVTGTPRPGSSMAGRFAPLLPTEDQSRLAGTYGTAEPETIAAQLSFTPRRRRNENIARTRQLLPYVIALGEHREPHEGVIPLGDLAVTADACRFFLIQLSTGRRVEPRVPHALEAGVHSPPLMRFLAEITTARSAVYTAFDFGAAAHLPYLPRARYKRIVEPALGRALHYVCEPGEFFQHERCGTDHGRKCTPAARCGGGPIHRCRRTHRGYAARHGRSHSAADAVHAAGCSLRGGMRAGPDRAARGFPAHGQSPLEDPRRGRTGGA